MTGQHAACAADAAPCAPLMTTDDDLVHIYCCEHVALCGSVITETVDATDYEGIDCVVCHDEAMRCRLCGARWVEAHHA